MVWDRIEAYPHLSVSRDTAASWLLKTASCLMSAVSASSCSTLALVLMRLGFDCSALIRLGYVSDWCFLLASLTLQRKDVVRPYSISSRIVVCRHSAGAKSNSGLPAAQRRAAALTVPDVSMVLTDVFRERHTPRAAGRCYVALVPSAIRHPFRHQFYMEGTFASVTARSALPRTAMLMRC